MLHENPLMTDIDVEQWSNLQDLLLDSAKEKRRIVVIHEAGEVLKFVHSDRDGIVRNIDKITNPSADAERIYGANAGNTDFVMVIERRAVERFFAQVQDSWSAGEDLDRYVHRMFATLDEYQDGIVTYPGPARTRLGLQWRLGAPYEVIEAAVKSYVTPGTTVVFGVFDGDTLWASLVLRFDADRRISLITTADPGDLTARDRKGIAAELVAWTGRKHAPCSLGLFTDLDGARKVLSSRDKLAVMNELAAEDRLIANPVPAAGAGILAGAKQ